MPFGELHFQRSTPVIPGKNDENVQVYSMFTDSPKSVIIRNFSIVQNFQHYLASNSLIFSATL